MVRCLIKHVMLLALIISCLLFNIILLRTGILVYTKPFDSDHSLISEANWLHDIVFRLKIKTKHICAVGSEVVSW